MRRRICVWRGVRSDISLPVYIYSYCNYIQISVRGKWELCSRASLQDVPSQSAAASHAHAFTQLSAIHNATAENSSVHWLRHPRKHARELTLRPVIHCREQKTRRLFGVAFPWQIL